MKGEHCKLVRFMGAGDTQFIIPIYQRNYDWKKENCVQLYDDLIKICKRNRRSHFFGSIVSVYKLQSANRISFLVIDGQQRLTTLSLLFLAMYNLIEEKVVIPNNSYLSQKIYETYLVNKFQQDETRLKLKPIKNDQAAFEKLFDETTEHVKESNLTANYKYFYERIQKQEITIDELFDAICSLDIINIQLENDDDPQLIFESLNSTGLDLSEGDKIRNYILMGIDENKQNRYYDQYWNKIENCTKYDVSTFIRDYLSLKRQSIPPQRKVYTEFKSYVEGKEGPDSIEDLLRDILLYAKRYEILLNGKSGSQSLDSCIERLNRLETTVTRPFFLEVLRLHNEQRITLNEVTDIFAYAENYLLRRAICDLPSNSLNKIFLMLHREIMRYDGTDENYVEKYKYTLLNKKEKARFPEDHEFFDAFIKKPIYLMNSKNKIYILERIENAGTAEDKDVYRHCDDGQYTIEHIMPQTLSSAWKQELGDNYKQIHDTWLHRIANLTLTAYNAKYSNCSFSEKKNMENGFIESGIRMNTWIAEKENWTEAELEERSQYLAKRAMNIWRFPHTNFTPQVKQMDSYTLDDDSEALTGRQLTKFSFKGTEYSVNSWVEMYQKVLQILFEIDPSFITHLAANSDETYAKHFSFMNTDTIKYVEIKNGVFVWVNTNTQSKLNILSRLFKQYDIELTDLVFYLNDETSTDRE